MKKISILFLLLVTWVSSGQLDFKELVPPNPDVASIMKPLTTPVTEYAGIPNINIPIYTIQEDGISVPILISYHAGGIRLGEESGNVGLGWSLQAGGMITRTVNGSDDFKTDTKAYLNHNEPLPDYSLSGAALYDGALRIIDDDNNCNFYVNGELRHYSFPETGLPQIDHMPDEFMYNFAGRSGVFYLNRDGSVFKKEKDGVIIIPEYNGSNINKLDVTFKIIAEDGTNYHFDFIGTTQATYENNTNYDSTWYLSEIETINNRNIIFNYDKREKIYPLKTFIQDFYDAQIEAGDICLQSPAIQCNGNGYRNYPGPQSEVDGVYLTGIDFPNGNVEFQYSEMNERLDIPSGYFLKNVSIYNPSRKINDFDLQYSYFGNPSASSGTLETGDFSSVLPINPNNPSLNLRLRLDKIVQDDLLEHSFQYNAPNNVPNKTSMDQDYWGFHNGARNSYYFIPRSDELAQVPIENTANRLSSLSDAKLFSLKRIVYPTKGYTEFDYELNTFYASGTTALPVPATVELEAVARADNQNNLVESQPFDPDPVGKMVINFQFAIYGTSIEPTIIDGQPRYENGPFNFQEDAYLELVDADTGQVIWTETYRSEAASLQFQQTGQAFFNISRDTGRHPDVDNYILRAHFKDYDDTYFGQARIVMTWQEEKETGTAVNPKDFSIGGGLRIKSIIDYSDDGIRATKRNYSYHYKEMVDGVEVEKSYGKIKTLPNYDIDKAALYKYIDLNGGLGGGFIVWVPEKQTQIVASASSNNSFSKDMGSYVGYDRVEMTTEDFGGNDNGKTIYNFYNFQDLFDTYTASTIENIDDFYKFPPIRLPFNGLLKSKEEYKRNNSDEYILLRKTSNEHEINGHPASTYEFYDLIDSPGYLLSGIREYSYPYTNYNTYACGFLKFQFYPHFSNRVEQVAQMETLYSESGLNPVTTTQQVFYDNPLHYMPTRTETVDSKGNTVSTQTWYPDDIDLVVNDIEGGPFDSPASSAINALKGSIGNNANKRIGQPIQTVSINNGQKLLQRTNLENFGNGIILPKTEMTLKGELSPDNSLQERATVHSYDDFGNPLEVSSNQGPRTSYLWGHSKTYVIAKIENASYAEIANALNISETDLRNITENDMATIEGLRNNTNLAEALITTFTYDPLVGITRVTDPRNYEMNYYYDPQRRLIAVKDDSGHLVTDYKYHYKGQSN